MAVTLAMSSVAAGCAAGETLSGPQPGKAAMEPTKARKQPAAQQFPSLAVLLRALADERPRLVDTGRNPFRMWFTAEAPAPVKPSPTVVVMPPLVTPETPGAEPDVELRLIGLVEAPESGEQVVVMSDGAGVHHGRVGNVLAGRYRLVALTGAVVTVEDLAHGAYHRLRFGGS